MPTRRKPNRLRVIEGQAPRQSPEWPALEDQEPPKWLPRAAKAEWKRVVGYIASRHLGHLQVLDEPSLAAYCMTWSTWLTAAQDVAKRGSLVPGRSSADAARGEDGPALVKNPSVSIMRDAGIQLRYWCREFGFTPDARGRMDLPAQRERTAADELLT